MEEQRLTRWEFQVQLKAGLCCGSLIAELLTFKTRGRGTLLPNGMANSKFLPSLLRLEMFQAGRSCDCLRYKQRRPSKGTQSGV